jgi:DNA-binding CsgD family transcriptional regulator/tetratricopeptide (TPR) repeat protein
MRLFRPALVGRDAEAAALGAALDDAQHGRGGAIFLVGEAGIGKTRLAAETEQRATARGFCVLRGRATASAPQFRPLTEALLSVLRHAGSLTYPELGPYRPALSRLIPEWRLERPPGPDDSLVVLAEAVLRLLTSLGDQRGCLIVLEDLHDADDDTLAVVEYLVDNLARSSVVLLATVRTESGAALELVRSVARRRAATVVELDRLADDAVRRLIAGCLKTSPEVLPQPALDRTVRDSDGVPFHVEELLAELLSCGALVRDGQGWRTSAPLVAQVPATVRASVVSRAARLGPHGQALLQVAAMLGRQFHAPVAGAAAGLDERDLLTQLRAAVDAQLVCPTTSADTYVFRHALTADAIREDLLPAERVRLSQRLAVAIEESFPDLPATWCQLAASLWSAAGQRRRAAELHHTAGRRAIEQGAFATAISLLDDGLALLDEDDPLALDLAEALLGALVVAGEIERAADLGRRFDLCADPLRRAAVRLRLARAAAAAGRWNDGLREVEQVRNLLGDDAGPELDALAAQLTFGHPSAERVEQAEALARRALDAAADHPEVACEALEVLGSCARLRDLAAADRLYEQALSQAERAGLMAWRVRMLYHLGVHDGVRAADADRLLRARELALQTGAVVTALDLDCELAVVHLARGEYDLADERAERTAHAAHRLRLHELRLIALGLRACVASHRGDRSGAARRLAEYRALGGDKIDFTAAVAGFGLAIGALLHEDRHRALSELDRAVELEQAQLTHYLSFTHGPHLFLSTLAGRTGWDEHQALVGTASGQAAWNLQFAQLTSAVLHGRAHRPMDAAEAVADFKTTSAEYPLARHLGLRLAAEAALADGWGEPVPWLQSAEEYFHGTGATAAAGACRTLLRRAGVVVPRRAAGSNEIPTSLRTLGVTVREFEVLALLGERLSNRAIGERLFLSPRTVEKHVASLLTKTGTTDRGALAGRYSALAIPSPPP